MSISSIIRGAGRGVASVGRAVQAASQKLDQAVSPQPAPAPAPAAAPAPAKGAPKGFSLPDLGPAPNPSDPQYQGEEGQKKLAEDLTDYQHKQDIHQAFTDLDKVYAEAHPQRNFQQEYLDEIRMQQEHEKSRPQGSGLARAALALGDFNPAVQQSGRSNLTDYNARVSEAQGESDKGFSQRMTLRLKMHEAAAAEAQTQGNWKKALAENEKAALLAADAATLAHRRDMEKTRAVIEGQNTRANIRADAMERTAKMRAQTIAAGHGLSGSFLSAFEKEAAKAVAKLLGPRDLTKEYTPADVESISIYLENLAEMFHDQQYGDGSSETYMGTHPKKRPQPKPAGGKEAF